MKAVVMKAFTLIVGFLQSLVLVFCIRQKTKQVRFQAIVSIILLFIIAYIYTHLYQGFRGTSVGKETAFNAGDPNSFPELGKSPGEGIGYRLQYYWASLLAQMVKNLPAVWETWIQSLGWEYPLEEAMATTSVFLPGQSHGQRSLVGCCPRDHTESDLTE